MRHLHICGGREAPESLISRSSTSTHALPEPSAEALEHSARLKEHIRRAIKVHGGWLGFDHFMELALYAPGLGYYSAGARKFGAAGDFITAPEISPLFSRCVAHQCAETLQILGGGSIVELGAGSGAMAAEVLAELDRLDVLPERYLILEVSGELRERQQRHLASNLPHLKERIVWLDELPDESFAGVVLGNEVLDALPVQRFHIGATGVEALGVEVSEGEFVWRMQAADLGLAAAVRNIERELQQQFAEGYSSEFSPRLPAQIHALAERFERGTMFFIDYGLPRRAFYHPERSMGTLMCHYRQRAHPDPFRFVGLQDITAYVDFTAVAEAGVAAGLRVAGYTTQAQFLLAAGLPRLAGEFRDNPTVMLARAQEVKRLTLPGEMGERFKVIALTKDMYSDPSGFGLRDMAHML